MPSAQATFCKKCSYRVALNRPDRDAALHRGPRIQTLTPPHPPRTRCASNSSRTSAPALLDAATLRPFQPAPRRKPRLRVRSRMGTHDAADRSNQAAPPLLRRLPHARRQHRQAPAGNGAESTAGRSVLPPKSLVTYTSSIRTAVVPVPEFLMRLTPSTWGRVIVTAATRGPGHTAVRTPA